LRRQARTGDHLGNPALNRTWPLLLLLLLGLAAHPGRADSPPPAAERKADTRRFFPADAVTRHEMALPGRTLRFAATAGSLPLSDGQGNLQAEIGYVAYTLADGDPATRPVTFVFNGGPGAASAYLHLGVLGPWRLPLDGSTVSPSSSIALVPNGETWLDFTDLVFIDPVGTGHSQAVGSGDDVRQRYYSVDGDISALSDVIARWLRSRERMASPKFYVGESYGGFRGPLIAERLQGQGIAFSGLVLLSPVLDFGWFHQPRTSPLTHVARLPSLAAASREAKGPVARTSVADAEAYAAGEYLADLLRGPRDRDAVERLTRRVAEYTGLDPALVRRLAGRIDSGTFQREILRASGRVASAYDTAVTGYDPDPTAARSQFEDPLLSAMTAPLASAMVDHLARTLNFKPDQRYELLNGSVNGAWRWGNGRGQAEAVTELRKILALDGNLRVLVAHGLTDLVTPYFGSQLILDQLPAFGPEPRVSLAAYPGGHMFYSREASRAGFRADAARLYERALEARRAGQGP
jgi:carboxypeptidase C (cathepsin A)